MSNIIQLNPYEVYEYQWCAVIKKRNSNWEKIILKPNAQEIDVSNLNIIIYQNGIEFL